MQLQTLFIADFIQGRSMLSTSDTTTISADKTSNHLQRDHGLAAAVDRQALDEN